MTIRRMSPDELFASFKTRRGHDAKDLNEAKTEERSRQIQEEQYLDAAGERRCRQCERLLPEEATCVNCNENAVL